ncbi:unnamed protein product [Linum tenue]|uniref:F-box domain-containing protein n=2 Tax=Linum tenue TaxID=586396 RepID=A0AAV0QQ14_9ROSI|nr:unnamed protein product [Linum tenue]
MGSALPLPSFASPSCSSEMSNPVVRYRELGYGEALAKVHRYPIVCRELSSILREAYPKLPKNLQSMIFDDTLAAFRLLPQMEMQSAVSAAHLLCQSAEAALPKQKKNLAVSEFRHAKVAQKRRRKAHHREETTAELPQDVLAHVFSFLDTQCLALAGKVCWSWNVASNNNLLWQAHYAEVFGSSSDSIGRENVNGEGTSVDWKEAFKRAYSGNCSKRLASNRGYCNRCKAVVWLDSMKCCSCNETQGRSKQSQITHITSDQVVAYLLHGCSSLLSSSDSDSDSDEEFMSSLWFYPKHITG